MTAVTSITRGSDGLMTTLTFNMPTQTTPFAPSRERGDQGTGMPASCSLSVFCRTLSQMVYTMKTAAHSAHPLSNQTCLGVQPTSDSAGPRVGYEARCWPENYFALFPSEWGVLDGVTEAADGGGGEGDASTVGFPGDHCLAGWTTACTTTVTAGAGALVAKYPQAWCCPPGQWACATATGPTDKMAPQRLCRSVMAASTGTEIWMTWDPPFEIATRLGSSSSSLDAFTWKQTVDGEPDPDFAPTVYRKVFPLAMSSAGAAEGGGGSGTGTGSGSGGGSDSGVAVVTVTAEAQISTDWVTEVVTARGDAVSGSSMQRRLFSPSSVLGDDPQYWRCAVAGVLGAAFAAIAVSLLGFVLLHRRVRGRNRRRHEVLAAAAAAACEDADEKCEVGVLM
ncbi:hypothetical protein F4819DRAFT_293273 [Hypoxylon fuscum]|nr:hypothetical protein F4819DRAFT_293273 [Hypoxylon fuscum]